MRVAILLNSRHARLQHEARVMAMEFGKVLLGEKKKGSGNAMAKGTHRKVDPESFLSRLGKVNYVPKPAE